EADRRDQRPQKAPAHGPQHRRELTSHGVPFRYLTRIGYSIVRGAPEKRGRRMDDMAPARHCCSGPPRRLASLACTLSARPDGVQVKVMVTPRNLPLRAASVRAQPPMG